MEISYPLLLAVPILTGNTGDTTTPYRYLAYNLLRFVLYLRRRLLSLLSTNPLAASAIRDLCSKTPLFFIELFCLLPYIAELTPFSIQHQLYKHLTKKMQRSAKPADLKASPFIPFRYQQTLIKTLVDRINKNPCHRACPDSIGEPASQTESCHLEPDSSTEAKEHASSSHLEPASFEDTKEHASERSPDRKRENHPFIIQKSSSVGATSAVLLVYLWYFLFRADSNFLIMTPNIFDLYMPKLSNYAKIPVFNFLMFVIKQLPEGLRPEVRFVRNRKTHFYCYLENTTNGNRIVGLSAGTKRDIAEILNSIPTTSITPQPATPPLTPQPPIAEQYEKVSLSTFFSKESGKETSMPQNNSHSSSPEPEHENKHTPTFTSILLDDHAFHTHADHHYLQLSKLTRSIISVSSPNGQSNLFYELADTAKKEDLFILHWIHNPLYDRAWYDTLIQVASAGFVEQFVNQQFAFRYRNTPPLTPNPPIAEQYVKVSLSTFFPKESGKETSTKPANNKTPQKKTTTKPANSQTPNKKASTKSANPQPPAEKAAFKHDTPTSATKKPKRPPILSALTGFVRKHVKTMTAITYNTYYDVRNHISKSHKANLSQPFVPYEDYNEKTIVQSWNRLNRLIVNKINMQLISGEKAVSLVNKYSSVPVSQSLIVTSEADRKLRYEFRVLFFNDGFVKNYYRKLLENRRRIEAVEKKRIEDEKLEKEVEEYNRQFREKYDRLSRDKDKQQPSNSGHLENQCHLEPDSLKETKEHTSSSHLEPDSLKEAKEYTSERSPYRKGKNEHSPSPERKHENPESPSPERKHENPQPPSPERKQKNKQPPPSSLKDQQRKREEENKLLFKNNLTPEGKFNVKSTRWKISITPKQTPKKPEPAPLPPPPPPEPEIGPDNPCPRDSIECPWSPQNPVYCNKYCPLLPENRNPSPQCHLEPDSLKEAKEYTSERSPERKRENPKSPSPERKQEKEHSTLQKRRGKNTPPPLPADLSAQANCPPEITYCPLGSDYHIPCYPECPHGLIHNYNRYMREEEAKRIQQKEKSKKKGNKSKSKNKGRPPP